MKCYDGFDGGRLVVVDTGNESHIEWYLDKVPIENCPIKIKTLAEKIDKDTLDFIEKHRS